jgi:Brp/Blh family beta-carotene 15,15'-monooxygenase
MAISNVGSISNINGNLTKVNTSGWRPFIIDLLKVVFFNRAFSILLLSLLLLSLGFGSELQLIVGNSLFFIGLITVGIPHGAVDHLLETGQWFSRSTLRFILIYLAYSLAMAVFWYLLPQLALCLFLFYSAWHFGQSDGEQWGFSNMFSFFWGCIVIFYLLGTHVNETNVILNSISGTRMPFAAPVYLIIPFLFVAVYIRSYTYAITILWLMISSQLPLMLAFGLYFIGQHSLSNWKNISRELKISHFKIWSYSLPFHLGAWLVLALFFFVWPLLNISSDFNRWGIFFIFIACMSLPHVITVHLFKSKAH